MLPVTQFCGGPSGTKMVIEKKINKQKMRI